MTPLLKIAVNELADQPYQTQALWAARIINALRGCPNGLAPGEEGPEDWSEDDEIWEAMLARTPELEAVVKAEAIGPPAPPHPDDDVEVSMEEFLNAERTARGEPPLPFVSREPDKGDCRTEPGEAPALSPEFAAAGG